jgi:NTP pyrophosphatase (non-canonical NTP hydrolase)
MNNITVGPSYVINSLCKEVHKANQQWWHDLETGEKLDRNVGEMLCLVHSEISEALEGYRKNQMDSHLPHRKAIEVELADALIRIFDLGAGLGLDLGGAYEEKMAYNAVRADHKREARLADGGKKF